VLDTDKRCQWGGRGFEKDGRRGLVSRKPWEGGELTSACDLQPDGLNSRFGRGSQKHQSLESSGIILGVDHGAIYWRRHVVHNSMNVWRTQVNRFSKNKGFVCVNTDGSGGHG
jgi:hypothetical protein